MRSDHRVLLGFAVAAVGLSMTLFFPGHSAASSGIEQELSFEGKIVTSAGINIPDGTYNMQFNIYTGCTNNTGAGCTSVWSENYLVGGTPVTFTSGTFQVNLGSQTAFGTSVPWDTYPLYLSIQVGNTSSPGGSCTTSANFTTNCGGDGVMSPYILLTSTPYALNAGQLGGLVAPTVSPSVDQCLEAGTSTAVDLTFANCALQQAYNNDTGGSTPAITLNSTQGTLNIQDASTTIGTNLFDINAGAVSGLGTTLFSVGNTGNTTVLTTTNSTTAFQVQNASSTDLITADTTNNKVDLGALAIPTNVSAALAPAAHSAIPLPTTLRLLLSIPVVASQWLRPRQQVLLPRVATRNITSPGTRLAGLQVTMFTSRHLPGLKLITLLLRPIASRFHKP
jgi:hypothetical protein